MATPASAEQPETGTPERIPSMLTSAIVDLQDLDQYLLSLLLPPTDDNSYLLKYKATIISLLRVATLLATRGDTPGMRILGLRMKTSSSKLVLYIILSCLAPNAYSAIKSWYLRRSLNGDRSGAAIHADDMEATGEARKMHFARTLVSVVGRVGPLMRLLLILGCWNGLVSSVDPFMVLSGCKLESNGNPPPRLHADYAHRRWLYEQGIETVKTLLGGLALARTVWKPLARGVWIEAQTLLRRSEKDNSTSSTCLMCRRCPPTIAVVTNCGHTYCYTCLSEVSGQGMQFHCLSCGAKVHRAYPSGQAGNAITS